MGWCVREVCEEVGHGMVCEEVGHGMVCEGVGHVRGWDMGWCVRG